MNRRLGALVAGALLLGAAPARAQKDDKINKEEVSFRSVDGVLLKGTFYPSTKGGNSPTVLMLHKLGGKRTEGDWEGLAVRLQAKGYAVMTFDFRGHGASTTIDNPKTFWQYPHNQVYLKNPDTALNAKKKRIDLRDFKLGYIPYLMNDIAAARHDLDNRNDNAQCNTSNLIIIGAEEGASLGFCWIASEFYRPQVYKEINVLSIAPGAVNTDPAGDDIAGAIWLSYRRHPGIGSSTISVPYSTWVSSGLLTPVRDKVQMWFAAGAKDAKGVDDARYMYDSVLNADKKRDKLQLTSKLAIDGTNLRGVSLIGQKGLPTDERIEQFIQKAVDMRKNQAQKRRNASEFKPIFIDPTVLGFGR